MFTGIKLYALLAALLAFVGLAGYGAYQHQSALAAQARVETVTHERDDLSAKLVQAEVEKAQLVQHQQETDAIVAAQRETERKLQDEKAQVWTQFDKLIHAQPKEDQDCATRALPNPVLEWLRDDGAGDGKPLPASQDPGKSPPGLPADKPRSADVG